MPDRVDPWGGWYDDGTQTPQTPVTQLPDNSRVLSPHTDESKQKQTRAGRVITVSVPGSLYNPTNTLYTPRQSTGGSCVGVSVINTGFNGTSHWAAALPSAIVPGSQIVAFGAYSQSPGGVGSMTAKILYFDFAHNTGNEMYELALPNSIGISFTQQTASQSFQGHSTIIQPGLAYYLTVDITTTGSINQVIFCSAQLTVQLPPSYP